jgi:hypothetical protein
MSNFKINVETIIMIIVKSNRERYQNETKSDRLQSDAMLSSLKFIPTQIHRRL